MVEPLSLNLPDVSTLCLAQSERLCQLSASIVTVGIPVSHTCKLWCVHCCVLEPLAHLSHNLPEALDHSQAYVTQLSVCLTLQVSSHVTCILSQHAGLTFETCIPILTTHACLSFIVCQFSGFSVECGPSILNTLIRLSVQLWCGPFAQAVKHACSDKRRTCIQCTS